MVLAVAKIWRAVGGRAARVHVEREHQTIGPIDAPTVPTGRRVLIDVKFPARAVDRPAFEDVTAGREAALDRCALTVEHNAPARWTARLCADVKKSTPTLPVMTSFTVPATGPRSSTLAMPSVQMILRCVSSVPPIVGAIFGSTHGPLRSSANTCPVADAGTSLKRCGFFHGASVLPALLSIPSCNRCSKSWRTRSKAQPASEQRMVEAPRRRRGAGLATVGALHAREYPRRE